MRQVWVFFVLVGFFFFLVSFFDNSFVYSFITRLTPCVLKCNFYAWNLHDFHLGKKNHHTWFSLACNFFPVGSSEIHALKEWREGHVVSVESEAFQRLGLMPGSSGASSPLFILAEETSVIIFFSLRIVYSPYYSVFLLLFLCSISCKAKSAFPIDYSRAWEFSSHCKAETFDELYSERLSVFLSLPKWVR